MSPQCRRRLPVLRLFVHVCMPPHTTSFHNTALQAMQALLAAQKADKEAQRKR